MELNKPPGPDDPQYWVKESITLRQDGKLEAAVAASKRALVLAPGDADALSSLAHALRWQGRFGEACEASRKATEAAPLMAAAWFNYAASLEGVGRQEDAISAYRRALEIRPDYAEAWSNLGGALTDAGRDEDALAAYRHAVDCDAGLAPIWSNLGNALRRNGRSGDAMAACLRATEIDPAFAPGWNNLGLVLWDQGLLGEATNALKRAIELDPAAETWQNLGDVLRDGGHFEPAEQAYRRALATGSPTAGLLTRLGALLRRQGRLAESMDHLQRALAADPLHVPSLTEIGQLLSEGGRSQEATAYYRAAVDAMLRAARAGDAESALDGEHRIYRAFVQTLDSEEHYARCFADWEREFVALGRRYFDSAAPARHDSHRVAFVLLSGHILGHTEVLFRMLEDARSLPQGIVPRVYVMLEHDEEFAARAKAAGVETVYAESLLPRGSRTPILERILWLRNHLRQGRFGTTIWVSTPVWATFAFSMRLAPVQIFWSMRFHPLSGPHIDGYITWGARDEKTRRHGDQEWQVVPLPFALDDSPPDRRAVEELRSRFPEAILLGTLAREDKINTAPFLQAVADILMAHPQAGFLWTGKVEHPAITAFFRGAGVAERCHFVGWVDTRLHAAALDVFLDTFPHGCGITSYQAFAAATPLLSHLGPYTIFGTHFWQQACALGGSPSQPRLNAPDEHPILCARDTAEYAALAGRLVADAAWRKNIGARGRAFYEEELENNKAYAERFFATVRRIAAVKLGEDTRGGAVSGSEN